jgi:hypothetical protein
LPSGQEEEDSVGDVAWYSEGTSQWGGKAETIDNPFAMGIDGIHDSDMDGEQSSGG